MAARRGKSQARRNNGNSGGLPGWAWMIIGVLITVVAVMVAPRLLKSDGQDGFYRPRANPDALPAPASVTDDDSAPAPAARPDAAAQPDRQRDADYDFYTLLPGQEVPMTEAELAASARAEQLRQQQADTRRQAEDAALDAAQTPDAAPLPTPVTGQDTPPVATTPAQAPAAAAEPATPAQGNTRFLLQAGSFSASGDAEALKARIALLGLSARVESAQIDGRTVYRVRMGPYGSASELAEAKGKLDGGGLDSMPIRVQ